MRQRLQRLTAKRPAMGIAALAVALIAGGCNPGHEEYADHADDMPNLCRFAEDEGVWLPPATRAALNIRTAEVQVRPLTNQIEAVARVYAPGQASLWVPASQASPLRVGDTVTLLKGGRNGARGHIAKLDRAAEPLLGRVEAVVEFDASAAELPIGTLLTARLKPAIEKHMIAIPQRALLETVSGDFVFLARSNSFLRRPVEIAMRADDAVGIVEGVERGDFVVTNGVAALWRIELNATRAGAACCPDE